MITDYVDFADTEEDVQVEADYPEETVDVKHYSITSYGLDYDVEGIVKRLMRKDIYIPEFANVPSFGLK